jgi:hypothetical protein
MDSVYFRFLIAALATWRISFLLVREEGPGGIFARFRKKFETVFSGRLLGCIKCTGTWIAVPFAFFVKGSWLELVVIWLALAGVTALIDEWTRPPFDWQETKDDGMLRTEPDRTAK